MLVLRVEAEKLDLVEHFGRLLDERDMELGYLIQHQQVQDDNQVGQATDTVEESEVDPAVSGK